jgi:enterochelin esterase-like enzyme
VADYCDKIVKEVVPWVSATYHTSQDPAAMAFGGSSLGGVAALYMGMRYPGAFGGLLVESPSLWIGEERFLQVGVWDGGGGPVGGGGGGTQYERSATA